MYNDNHHCDSLLFFMYDIAIVLGSLTGAHIMGSNAKFKHCDAEVLITVWISSVVALLMCSLVRRSSGFVGALAVSASHYASWHGLSPGPRSWKPGLNMLTVDTLLLDGNQHI